MHCNKFSQRICCYAFTMLISMWKVKKLNNLTCAPSLVPSGTLPLRKFPVVRIIHT